MNKPTLIFVSIVMLCCTTVLIYFGITIWTFILFVFGFLVALVAFAITQDPNPATAPYWAILFTKDDIVKAYFIAKSGDKDDEILFERSQDEWFERHYFSVPRDNPYVKMKNSAEVDIARTMSVPREMMGGE